ncbi:hypothetical protein [Streptomyces sp. NRRL S-350]|uniref:hypothetical protein n=1 Tax=Streptomyces sp. NRRL S-350 TaxID=1463902 RepID=UPI00068C5E60|nr:hypothetical protein [Streptomyces sp. NRRL S-350]
MTTQPIPAAAHVNGPSLLAIGAALVIAVLLIGAFAWGSHRITRRRPPRTRTAQGAAGARADSWRTPDGDGPRDPGQAPPDRAPDAAPHRHRR